MQVTLSSTYFLQTLFCTVCTLQTLSLLYIIQHTDTSLHLLIFVFIPLAYLPLNLHIYAVFGGVIFHYSSFKHFLSSLDFLRTFLFACLFTCALLSLLNPPNFYFFIPCLSTVYLPSSHPFETLPCLLFLHFPLFRFKSLIFSC